MMLLSFKNSLLWEFWMASLCILCLPMIFLFVKRLVLALWISSVSEFSPLPPYSVEMSWHYWTILSRRFRTWPQSNVLLISWAYLLLGGTALGFIMPMFWVGFTSFNASGDCRDIGVVTYISYMLLCWLSSMLKLVTAFAISLVILIGPNGLIFTWLGDWTVACVTWAVYCSIWSLFLEGLPSIFILSIFS